MRFRGQLALHSPSGRARSASWKWTRRRGDQSSRCMRAGRRVVAIDGLVALPARASFSRASEACACVLAARVTAHSSVQCRAVTMPARGGRLQAQKDGLKKDMMNKDGTPVTKISRPMSNYWSMGVESRIGVGFDKSRTTSQAQLPCTRRPIHSCLSIVYKSILCENS